MSNSATPWTVALQAPVHGILQARMLEWVAIPSPWDLPNLGTEPGSPTLQADSLPSESLGKSNPKPEYKLTEYRLVLCYA